MLCSSTLHFASSVVLLALFLSTTATRPQTTFFLHPFITQTKRHALAFYTMHISGGLSFRGRCHQWEYRHFGRNAAPRRIRQN